MAVVNPEKATSFDHVTYSALQSKKAGGPLLMMFTLSKNKPPA